jgi:hypothetical protein
MKQTLSAHPPLAHQRRRARRGAGAADGPVEYRQQVRENRRRRLAEKAMIRKVEKKMRQVGETGLL